MVEPSVTKDNGTKGNGLKTALDILIAPKEALEAIRATPTWGWAFLIAAGLLIVGFFLQQPASVHAQIGTVANMVAHNSLYANISDEQKQRIIENAKHPPAYQAAIGLVGLLLVALVAALLNALVLLVTNAIGKGQAKFATLWAASINLLIPTLALGSLTLGIICIIRGPDAFATQMDLMRAVPGLGTVSSGATGLLAGFLATITVFAIWGCFLNVMTLRTVAGVSGALSWIVPVLILVCGALLGGAGAAFAG